MNSAADELVAGQAERMARNVFQIRRDALLEVMAEPALSVEAATAQLRALQARRSAETLNS